MYNKKISHRLLALGALILLVFAGCDLRKFERVELYQQKPQEYQDHVFAASEDFALGKISAMALKKILIEIKEDPKRLRELVAKKNDEDGPFKGYSFVHLLVSGLATAELAQILNSLLSALGADAKSIITSMAHGQSVFDVLRNQLIRPKNELPNDNLLVAHVLLNYEPALINHASLGFAEKNQLFLMDKRQSLHLFKAMDAHTRAAWDLAADDDYAAAKDVLAALMQQIGPQKIIYKNKILGKTHLIKFLDDFKEYGFNHDDLLADDFAFENGLQGKFLTVYAYRLGDIRTQALEKQKQYVAVVKRFAALFDHRQSYVKYASDEAVKDFLWDPDRSSAFRGTRPAINSEAAALDVLGLLDATRKTAPLRVPRPKKAKPPIFAQNVNNIEAMEPEPQPIVEIIIDQNIDEPVLINEPVVFEKQERPLIQVEPEPILDRAKNPPNAGSNKAQRSPQIAKALNMFNSNNIHSDASPAHFLQQVKEIAINDTKIADGVRSKALDSLEYLKKLATKAWSELVQNNPANEVLTIFKRKSINIHEKNYELTPLKALPTKDVGQFSADEQVIDQKGQKIKASFKGVIAGSRMAVLVTETENYLATCTETELKFLASQMYFWTDLLNNVPDIFGLLSPSQIQVMSTVMANADVNLREEALAVLQRLIKHLDISEDPDIIEKIAALVPAAYTALFERHLEDRLREKLGAIKIAASRTNDEHKWHLADAQIQRLDHVAHERRNASSALMPKPKDFDDAMQIIAGLVTITHGDEFQKLLLEFLPSGHDHEVVNALYLLSNDYKHLKDLLFVLTGEQLQRIFIVCLGKNHQRTSMQTQLVKNLIRGLEPENADFVMLIQTILANIEEINGYPDTLEDFGLLEETWESFQGALHASLKRYDQKAGPTYSTQEKFYLMAKFDLIRNRLAVWRQHKHDVSNVELLAKLKLQEPKPLEAPEGGFGLQGSKHMKELLIPGWYRQNEMQNYLLQIIKPSFYPASEDEQNYARAFLSQTMAQAAFLDAQQQDELKNAVGRLLGAHSVKTPLLDFVYQIKTEHEAAALMNLLPNDPGILAELVKYFNVGDNVAHSTFMRMQQLGKFLFRYVSKAQVDILMDDAKFWELLGAQPTAAGLALEPWAFDALTAYLLDNYQSRAEQNFARALSKIDIYDQDSAERAYERLLSVAKRAELSGVLTLLKTEINRKTNALQQFLAIDAPVRVKALKKMLK